MQRRSSWPAVLLPSLLLAASLMGAAGGSTTAAHDGPSLQEPPVQLTVSGR